MIRTLVIVFSAVLLVSCNDDQIYPGAEIWSVHSEKRISSLIGEKFTLEPIIQITKVKLYGSQLFIVGKVKENNCLLHIYDGNTGKKLISCAEVGRGPNEFSGLPLEVEIDKEKGEILITDRSSRLSRLYDINEILAGKMAVPKKTIILNDLIGPVIAVINDESFLCHAPLTGKMKKLSEPPEMLILHDVVDLSKRVSVSYPSKSYVGEFLYYQYNFSFAYGHSVLTSPNKKRILVVYHFMDIIEIYDNRLNLLRRLQGPDFFFPSFEASGDGLNIIKKDNNRDAFDFPIVGDDEFWVHYSGGFTNVKHSSYPKIFAFNWDGELLRSFQSDSLPILVDIDFKNRTAYGVVKYGELRRFKY